MKTVVVNESFLEASHLDRLAKLGEVVVTPDTTTIEDLLARTAGADAVIADCFSSPLAEEFFSSEHCPKFLTINSTGFDRVDIAAAKQHGIRVANVPGFSTESVAERTIALIFGVAHKLKSGDAAVHSGVYSVDPCNAADAVHSWREVSDRTLGVIGLGAIGTRIAEIGLALGMEVVGYNRTPKAISGVTPVSMGELAQRADVIALALAATPDTVGLISADYLASCLPGVIFVNIGRGDLIDQHALVSALESGQVSGYGSDVLTDCSPSNPLLNRDNVLLTPHSAFYTANSLSNAGEIITANVEAWAAGHPINVVNA